MKYSPPLDGLRAVAILPVLVFHAFPGTLKGGFTGVDVFFVISGYLITSVILHDLRAGDFSMREFYLRRIQRLLPNAAVMILVTLAISLVALLPSAAVPVARHGLWTLFNLSNVHIYQHIGGYWGENATSVPLLHTWSLAVEEQFYLLFPATLWFLARRPHPRLFAATACLLCASLGLSIWGTWTHPSATFYLLPTRAWEPLLGAALAVVRVPSAAGRPLRRFGKSLATEVTGWGGLAMIVAGFLLATDERNFPGVIVLLPTLGTLAVLVSVADGETGVARLLSTPSLVAVGTLSYSLYLWHWPLIVIGRTFAELTDRSPRAGALVGAGLCLPIAWLAHRFVEQPLRRRGPGRRRRLLVIAGLFSLAVAASLILSLRHPVSDPGGVFDRPTYDGIRYSVLDDSPPEKAVLATKAYDVLFAPAEPRSPEVWRSGGIVHPWGHGPPRVVVLGNSHAAMYGKVIDEACRREGVSVAFLSASGTNVFFPTRIGVLVPTLDYARAFDAARRRWLDEWKPDAILVIDNWDHGAEDPGSFERRVRELVSELSTRSRRVIAFSQVPVLRIGQSVNLREFVTWRLRTTGALPTIRPDSREPSRRSTIPAFEAVARDFPNFRLLRVDRDYYLEDGSVRYSSGRSFLYMDDDHLSEAGAERVRDSVERAIAEACAR